LYILKDKLISFKIKDDESILEMFHRLQVIFNDLKTLGEKINDDDVSHRILMCLPSRFETLRLLIIRGGLKEMTPNQVLGDTMTQETYRVERDGVDKDDKKEDEDKKKKGVAFKAISSSKNKGKSKKESSDDEDASNIDDKAMAFLVHKMGKFIKKKGYSVRKRRDHKKEYARRYYKWKSPNHIVADGPYNSENDKDEKKHKKVKKEKGEKEKKMTFTKKKMGSDYVVTWDSEDTSDDDGSSDDDKKSVKKALASITINNKPSIFDTPSSCLMAKAHQGKI
jgi:hypothetical protein